MSVPWDHRSAGACRSAIAAHAIQRLTCIGEGRGLCSPVASSSSEMRATVSALMARLTPSPLTAPTAARQCREHILPSLIRPATLSLWVIRN